MTAATIATDCALLTDASGRTCKGASGATACSYKTCG